MGEGKLLVAAGVRGEAKDFILPEEVRGIGRVGDAMRGGEADGGSPCNSSMESGGREGGGIQGDLEEELVVAA